MLSEVIPTRQIPHEPRRSWFIDDTMDLIVWYRENDTILGFQLCDDKGSDEHALSWFQEKGYAYERVDDGEGHPGRPKMTPVLLQDGVPDVHALLSHFGERSALLPAPLRAFVQAKLLEFKELPRDKPSR